MISPLHRQAKPKSCVFAMLHRGPDADGYWVSPDRRAAFGHRRLSIIDISASGNQPMIRPETGTSITFNGEIYNYRELRRELEQRGYSFRTHSDTEVLLVAYDAFGPEMVRRLRGMFAFAIWDEQRKGLFLARDPMGIKPLYYSDDGKSFRVASQVKALLEGDIETSIDPAGCVSFFLLGYVAEPFTIHKAIKGLPAGHTMWIDGAGPTEACPYFSVRDTLLAAERRSDAQRAIKFYAIAKAMERSVGAHMVADVPVGVFLSAGLDSTAIASLAARHTDEPLRTITLAFEEFAGTEQDETPIAEEVANFFHTQHTTVRIQQKDFVADRDRIFAAMDQPSIDGVNTYYVSKAAAQSGLKVALSGVGGDELFGSYPSYNQVPRIAHTLRGLRLFPEIGLAFRTITSSLMSQRVSPKYASLFEYGTSLEDAYLLRRALYMPWELPQFLDPDLVSAGWQALRPLISFKETIRGLKGDHARIAALEMSWYMRNQLLRDTDWAGMAHSLEVRTPLVDATLLEELAPLLVQQLVPSKKDVMMMLPTADIMSVMTRPKTGFAVPVHQWLNDTDTKDEAARGLRGWAKLVFSHHAKL
jgi:asparagine synthase (glutamine-hydrolysing)